MLFYSFVARSQRETDEVSFSIIWMSCQQHVSNYEHQGVLEAHWPSSIGNGEVTFLGEAPPSKLGFYREARVPPKA